MVNERIGATGEAQRLLCTLYPEWREFDTDHYCGQWAPEGGRQAALAVKDLRRQLKHSREVSAKRLARLRNGAERS